MKKIQINCDMGESFGTWHKGRDEAVMSYIDMANIACGFHASDFQTMAKTVGLAKKHDIQIGAHPGYPDLLGFGRKPIAFTGEEIKNMVLYQVGALQAISKAQGATVSYVKPHGALYNTMMEDLQVFSAILSALQALPERLALMILARKQNTDHIKLAQQYQIELLFEAFCDRRYTSKGNLQSRDCDGAVFDQVTQIEQQARSIIERGQVQCSTGSYLPIQADSICLHGDNHLTLDSAKYMRNILNTSDK